MMVAGFIANRIAFNRQQSFSRFIIRLSIAATVISVMVMIVTLAFANGFQEAVSQKIFSFWGHIRIQEKQPGKAIISEEIPITRNPGLEKSISADPEVVSVHPFATRYALLKTKEEIEGVLIKGFDSTYRFGNLSDFIQTGRPPRFTDSLFSREVLLSVYTADRMKLRAGDSLIMYFLKPGEEPSPRKIFVSGTYKTGIEEYDRLFALGDIRLIRRLNQWSDDQVGGYEVFLRDYRVTDSVTNRLHELDSFPATWDAISVKKVSPNIFDWLKMQDLTRNVLIGFMIAVAVINLITCLLILVLERVRMIGVLKALGAQNWTVQQIFLRQSLFITLTGIVAGTVIALLLLYLQTKTGFIRLPENAYYLSEAAVKISWWEILIVDAGTLLITLLILMIPSLLVRKIQPVKAIRFR
ncbi:MAG: ABC transporter permease [Chitinophagaceae bacterium]|nr:ABC transporter permease [Chitinophagaceae bacterium]